MISLNLLPPAHPHAAEDPFVTWYLPMVVARLDPAHRPKVALHGEVERKLRLLYSKGVSARLASKLFHLAAFQRIPR